VAVCCLFISGNIELSLTNVKLFPCADWGAFSMGRLVAIPLSKRASPGWLLLGNFAGAIVGMAHLSVCTERTPHVHVWTATVVYGVSLSSAFPNVINHAERILPVSGRVLSVFVVGSACGEMLVPFVIASLQPLQPHAFFPAPLVSVCFAQLSLLLALRVVAKLIPSRRPSPTSESRSSTGNEGTDRSPAANRVDGVQLEECSVQASRCTYA
jgi:fucose permease